MTRPKLSEDISSLGEILIRLGAVDEDTIIRAREIQEDSGGLLGEILVKNGWASIDDIANALRMQASMRETSGATALKTLVNGQIEERRRTTARLAAICDV